jgi:hypothetical protein
MRQSRNNKTARRCYRRTTTASNVIGMKKPHLDTGVGVNSYVAEVADRLHDRLAEVSSELRRSLEDQIPELRGDAALVELLGTSVEGNVDTVLHALRYDIAVERVEAPTAALEYARRLAQHGVPVNALVRAYRLGQRRMNEAIFAELRAIDIPEGTRVAVIEAITGTMFEYIDWMSQQVVVVYEDERERWLENQNSLRALRVREILAGKKAVDVDAVTTSIRYPLRWHHLALVMWYPDLGAEGDELARLQRFVREVGEVRGDGCHIEPRWPMSFRRSAVSCRRGPTRRVWQSERWPRASRAFAARTARRSRRGVSRSSVGGRIRRRRR